MTQASCIIYDGKPVKHARAVIISHMEPVPMDYGKKAVVAGVVRYLKKRFGSAHVVYVLVTTENWEVTTDYPARIIVVRHQPGLEHLVNTAKSLLTNSNRTLQESWLSSRKLTKTLQSLVSEMQPDFVFCDTVRVGQHFEHSRPQNVRYLLFLDDLFSVRYERMLTALDKYPDVIFNALGTFKKFLPRTLHSLLQNRALQRQLLVRECNSSRVRECEITGRFDTSLLVSNEETRSLGSITQSDRVLELRPELGLGHSVRHYQGQPIFVFLGALDVPPNEFSLILFLTQHMQEVLRCIPEVQIRIVGRAASKQLTAVSRSYGEHIKIEGFVENLDNVFEGACAMIAPLLFGSGIKIKVLDALGRGMPVISTSIGLEGIPVNSNSGCHRVDDLTEFPAAMASLLDPEANQCASAAALALYRKHYDVQVVYELYDRIFR